MPIDKSKKIAIIGDFAFNPRYQGAGSSMVNATVVEDVQKLIKKFNLDSEKEKKIEAAIGNIEEKLEDLDINPIYEGAGITNVNATNVETVEKVISQFDLNIIGMAHGYSRADKKDESLVNEAIELAKQADIVLYFFGLNEASESEGLDRTHLRIPNNQITLLEKLSKANDNIVGVISAGSCIEMPWENNLKGILHGYLFGQAGMGAVFELLNGEYSPSGKLSESIVKKYEDVPNIRYYPSKERTSDIERVYL